MKAKVKEQAKVKAKVKGKATGKHDDEDAAADAATIEGHNRRTAACALRSCKQRPVGRRTTHDKIRPHGLTPFASSASSSATHRCEEGSHGRARLGNLRPLRLLNNHSVHLIETRQLRAHCQRLDRRIRLHGRTTDQAFTADTSTPLSDEHQQCTAVQSVLR